jgi:hypothetical protein
MHRGAESRLEARSIVFTARRFALELSAELPEKLFR